MSKIVIPIASGKAIRLSTEKYDIIIKDITCFDIDGCLTNFKLVAKNQENSIEYIYIDKNGFYKEDQNNKGLLAGYYQKSKYEEYRNKKNNLNQYNILKQYKIQESSRESTKESIFFDYARKGDLFKIDRIEFLPNYVAYYKNFTYEFTVQDEYIDFLDSSRYPQKVDTNPASPTYFVKKDTSVNLLDNPTGKFYTDNFGKYAHEAPESIRATLARGMTLICFGINNIIKNNVLDKLAIEPIDKIKDPANYDSLTQIDKEIHNLLKKWKYIPGDNTRLLTDLSVEGFTNYYKGLFNLKKFFFLMDENNVFPPKNLTAEKESERRMVYLLDFLPPESLIMLSYDYKIAYLEKLMKSSITGDNESRVLAIVYSIGASSILKEREDFLNFLLKKNDGVATNFDVLFHKLDDKTLAYILPTASMFFKPEESSKGNFCLAVYKIWYYSTYNMYYIPENVTPNSDGLNPDSFFIKDNNYKKYYNENVDHVLKIDAVKTSNTTDGPLTLVKNEWLSYTADEKLEDVYVNITKTTNFNHYYLTESGNHMGNTQNDGKEISKYKLHLYQPITLSGFKQNLDFEILSPEEGNLPAFLFYYYKEFDRLRKVYATYSLAIDLAAEVALFFGTGGLGQLKHLKYVTKIGNALRKADEAEKTVVFAWKGANATTETVTLLAATCASFSNYYRDISGTVEEREAAEKAGLVFVLITVCGGILSVTTRAKTLQAAKRAQASNGFKLLPESTQKFIDGIIGVEKNAVLTFLQRIDNKPKIKAKLNQWLTTDEALHDAFIVDFRNADDSILAKLDQDEFLDNYKKLFDRTIKEKSGVNIITNTNKVNAITKYYDVPELRVILEPLENKTRWYILESFKTIDDEAFIFLKNDPEFINYWYRHLPEGRLDIIENIKIEMKHRSCYPLLIEGKYDEIMLKFEHELKPSIILNDFPGVKYIYNEEPLDVLIEAAKIAERTDDVPIIAQNVGVSELVVGKAKENWWKRESLYVIKDDNEKSFFSIGRSVKYEEDIKEWSNAIKGIFQNKEDFKWVLAHEYVEGELMTKYGINYTSFNKGLQNVAGEFGAHDIAPLPRAPQSFAPSGYNIRFLINQNSIPKPNQDLSNLDEIVKKIAEIYNLKKLR